ncbi:MAG TPA: TonB family protein [Pyrinomonadaceae bacterium]|nr:TonB family protein [Pyrinomonadaceae bacterium]
MNCMNCGNSLPANVKFCPSCGTPTPSPQPPPYAPPGASVQTSWSAAPQIPQPPKRKSRAGKILLILFGLLIFIGAGAGLAIYFGYKYVESSLKSSEAYKKAEGELKRSGVVAEKLGKIKSTGFPVGSFRVDADGSGEASYTMSVEGTKASGRYFVTMARRGGDWRISRAFVKLDGGEMVNVVDASEESVVGEESDDSATDDADATDDENDNAAGGKTIKGGVLNSKAITMPAPAYPAVAKAVHASGTVTVAIVVDEKGKVVSARAESGHPLLQAAAVAAARQARFSPTLLSGQPVKVRGTITYEFKPE